MAYLGYDGVDFAVDSDAAVPGPLAGLLREPVVAVPPPQNLHDGDPKLFQLYTDYQVLSPTPVYISLTISGQSTLVTDWPCSTYLAL